MKEFDLIKRYFSEQVVKRKDVLLGIGDDCAILKGNDAQNIAVTTDTLVAGVHFPHNTSAKAIGHKSIAVSLSDLAAMGAEPAWASLAITMPTADEAWIKDFCEGVFELCEYANVQLIGGDTTQGPLSITVTAQGFTLPDKHITRGGAKPGDWVYVSADIGDAGLALMHINGDISLTPESADKVQRKLDFPKPRILLGQALRGYVSSAIDISDGLFADLQHICTASNVGATIELDKLPLSDEIKSSLGDKAIEVAVNAGDDYELLFTVSETNKVSMDTSVGQTTNRITCIGQINNSNTITTTFDQKPCDIAIKGFQHF